MEQLRFHAKYECNGQTFTADAASTPHYALDIRQQGACLKVSVLPNQPICFTQFSITFPYLYQADSRIFVNGYQSWTDSREYFINERLSHLYKLYEKKIMSAPMQAAGDYSFKKYPKKKGVFHGYSYSYVRNGKNLDLFGSLSERNGYTILTFDCNRNVIMVEKDLAGVMISAPYEALDLVQYQGEYDAVFDQYFSDMAIPAPRVQHKCGYTTWYNYYPHINEQIVTDDLNALAKLSEQIDIFQIDDGYQTAVGDWLSIDRQKFPNGMKAIADKIHEKNMMAGLWLAPIGAEYNAQVVKEHPDWLVKNIDGSSVECGGNWGGFYALDIEHPEAAAYIRHVFDVVLNTWGFDMVKLDFLYAACILPSHGKSRGQLMCEAMDFIRDCVGDKLILGCGVPLAPAFGKVDFCRIGADMGLGWARTPYTYTTHREDVSTEHAINNAIFRRGLDGRAFCNDPDVFLLRDSNIHLSFPQRKLITKINKVFGNLLFISDNVDQYNAEQMNVFLDTIRPSRIESKEAEYIKKNVLEVRFLENGVAKRLRFHVINGKLIDGEI